jgi:hypothetical protein
MQNKKSIEAVNRIPNERLEDLIHDAISAKMNDPDCKIQFQEFDVEVRKEVDMSVFADVQVYGMAGDTTKDEFVDEKSGTVVKGGGSLDITLDNDKKVKFVYDSIVNLNATDYKVTYSLA